jgi:hypothetical protein
VGKPNPCWRKEHHNLVGIWCRDIFSFCWSPSEHLVGRKEVILDQLEDFTLICSGFLEHFWMGSGHGARGGNPKPRFTESQEMVAVSMRRREMAMEVKVV